MNAEAKKRVAVIGASGIGKHHANWWTIEGAEICAFAGSNEQSVEATRDSLANLIGFKGRGYSDVDAMLRAEAPDIVDVCSPPPLHYAHVRSALSAGCDVLCEKPFVYDPGEKPAVLLGQAGELAALAKRQGRTLGVCTQYMVAGALLRDIWRRKHGERRASEYKAHLASPAKGRAPDPERIWVDLSPHLLSGLQVLAPQGCIARDTLETNFRGNTARASFRMERPDAPPVLCELTTENTTGDPAHIRHLMLDGYLFRVEGAKDADGVYCSRIETPDGIFMEADFMRLLIRAFLAGRPVADAATAMINLEWMLGILESARAHRS